MLAGLVIREAAAADISTASSLAEHLSAADLAKIVLAINAGGEAYTAENGIEYAADAHYQGGTSGGIRACVAGTHDDPIYQDERYGDFSYELPLANGHYDVVLQLNEIWAVSPIRVFKQSLKFKITNRGTSNLIDWEVAAYLGANNSCLIGTGANFTTDENLVTISNMGSDPLASGETISIHMQGQTNGTHRPIRCY